MKRKASIILSHLAVILLGFFLMKTIGGKSLRANKNQNFNQELAPEKSTMRTPSSGRGTRERSTLNASPSNLQKAWNSIVDQKLSRQERILAQRRFLEKWAEVDLHGAMKAILGESWKDEEGMEAGGLYEGALAPALAKAFSADPKGSWHLIQSGEFGMGAGMFRKVWFRSLGQSDPTYLASVIGDVSGFDRKAYFAALTNGVQGQEALKQKAVDTLMRQSDEAISTKELLEFIDEKVSHEELVIRLVGTDFETREGQILRLQFANSFGEALGKVSDLTQVESDIAQSLEMLPKEQRAHFVLEVVKAFEYRNKGADAERKMLSLYDTLISEEHWASFESQELKNQFHHFRGIPDLEFAEWATTLPPRKETESLFHAGIKRYVGNNMEKAWEWIHEFDDERLKEQALVAYSAEAANKHGDWEESWRAINLIKDTELRRNARNWRPLWMKRKDTEEGRK